MDLRLLTGVFAAIFMANFMLFMMRVAALISSPENAVQIMGWLFVLNIVATPVFFGITTACAITALRASRYGQESTDEYATSEAE